MNDDILYDRLWLLASTQAPDLSDLASESLYRMLAMARIHGVLGLVLPQCTTVSPTCQNALELAGRAWRGEVVQSMRVRRHAQTVLAAMEKGGIPAVLVKGPDFADHLFADPRMRPTLDVDILVPRMRFVEAARLLEASGHHEKTGQPGPFLPTGVLSERTWVFPSPGADIEVDLHWSLVHFPYFRRQASIDYWNLDWRWLPTGKGELTSASRLIIAVVHALYHHQFERLLQLVDVQLACRKVVASSEIPAVRALMERTGTKLALEVTLRVAARVLNDPDIETFRRALLGAGEPNLIPEALYLDARRNLRTIRTHYMSPSRQRIRNWLLKQPMRPEPGWEFRPPTAAPRATGAPASTAMVDSRFPRQDL